MQTTHLALAVLMITICSATAFAGTACNEVINLTIDMTDSSFNNETNVSGCVINLTVAVENASQDYTQACTVGGTDESNDTWDYCISNCTTNALAACSYDPLELNYSDSLVNTTYPCDLNITRDEVINLSGVAEDVWNYSNRTLTDLDAGDVWSYEPRSLSVTGNRMLANEVIGESQFAWLLNASLEVKAGAFLILLGLCSGLVLMVVKR